MSFLGEIKKRKVVQAALVYAVAAWLLIQVAATIEEPLRLPPWFDTAVIVVVIIGFPLALILSWAFDVTSSGIVRTKDAQKSQALQKERAAEARVLPNSVAVLPLTNLSTNPDDAYFAAGIHEEILNHLAKIKEMSVIARTSVMQYADAARPITEIARELSVSAVMEGSVRYAGDQVRVTAQLIDGATGTHLWTETYDRDLADIFAIQSDIAKHIARALNLHLYPEDTASLEEHPIDDLRAYECYLRARYEYSKFTAEGGERSIHFLKKGLDYEPDNELLNLAMGYAYFNYGSSALGADMHDEYLTKAEQHARRVLAANSDSPDGNGLLGLVLFDRFQTLEGLRLLRKGVSSPTRNLDTLTWAAFCYAMCGKAETVKPWIEELGRVDPYNAFSQWTIAWHHLMHGDLEEAESFLRRAHNLEPNSPTFRTGLALVLIYLERNRDAQGLLEAGEAEEPRREVWHVVGRILFHILNQMPETATELLDDDLKADAKSDMLYAWLLADCFALLGDPETSLEWLRTAIEGGFWNPSFFKETDTVLADLRSREEFESLLTTAHTHWKSID